MDAARRSIDVATGLGFLADHEVHQAQFAGGEDGSLYVVWREPGDARGSDLWLARHGGGAFEPPVRINDLIGSVAGVDLDESRAAVAVGRDGLIAVAWSTGDSDIRAALSRDGGASFAPSVSLNSDVGSGAYRGFVDIDVDAAGIAHAAWIDGRFARRGAEEPAELYYARIEDGAVTEVNLTEAQIPSICGCCRIDVAVRDDDRVVIAFRNTGSGYRDIFRVEAGADRMFGEPQRLGPPMWELRGCPVIGPLNVGDATLWVEASTGKRRLLAATATDGSYEVVGEDTEEWAIERPPRPVIGSSAAITTTARGTEAASSAAATPGSTAASGAPAVDGLSSADTLLLLPGRPSGKLLRGAGTRWTVVADAPRWAMSAAFVNGRLVLLGDIDGEAMAESRDLGF